MTELSPEEILKEGEGLRLAQIRFRLNLKSDLISAEQKEKDRQEFLRIVQDNNNVHAYVKICQEQEWPIDEAIKKKMDDVISAKLADLEEKVKDAKENLGENEVREFLLQRAQFLAQIGDKDGCIAAFETTLTHPKTTTGQKMDILFGVIRVGIFWNDLDIVQKNIEKAKILIEQGGDWERRNRLKVYEAAFSMAIRDFKKAALLFLDSISTFTAYELFDYDTFVQYTIITSVVSLDRKTLRKRVIQSPEVLQVIHSTKSLQQYLNAIYNCEYKLFFHALVDVVDIAKRDRFLAAHNRYIIRECRVVAYQQYLKSYKSVRLQSMAAAFGVGVDFLDNELEDFVSSGRLSCKIDKVNGVVESNRPDNKNDLYQKTIKQGDALLNRIQKLSRVITL